MKRRQFVTAAASTTLASAASPADPLKNSLYHLVWYYMRNGTQTERTQRYLSAAFLPAARRAGVGPCGFFSPVIGERSPFVLSLVTYPSYAAVETIHAKMAEDKEFQKASDDYNSITDPPYV